MSRFPYNDCNECPHYNQASCALSAVSQKLRQQFCPLLKLRIRVNDVNLHRPGEQLPSSYFPKWLTEKAQTEQQEMDYSRDDTKEIASKMQLYNN